MRSWRMFWLLLILGSAALGWADATNRGYVSYSDLPLNECTKGMRLDHSDRSLDRITPPPSGPVTLDPEWTDCEGVLVRYPFNWGTWIFSSMVDEIQDVAVVYIIVANSSVKNDCINYLISNGVPLDNVEFITCQTNTVWIRDYGPWFIWQEDSSLAIVDMPYAWNPSWTHDDYVPEFLETYWGMDYYGPNLWHDGGNMMTDGHGVMMMSNYVNEENPGLSNAQICQIYQDYFGQDTIYIFQKINYDLTGHIDLWAKIMNDTTILVAQMQPDDPNYALVESHAAYMATIPTVYGTPFRIVRCPMPPRTWYSGYYYYKSYLNSLLVNGKALVPTYNLELDAQALASYQEALGADWEVVGIFCAGIAYAGGAIHCTTIGVPRHDADYLVDVNLNSQPVSPPVTIPAGGGQFNYSLSITNLEPNSIHFDVWMDLTLPGGSLYGPVLLRENLTLAQGASLNRSLMQNIPGRAPAGIYSYNTYVGSYLPRVVSAQDSFAFEKLPAGYAFTLVNDWEIYGWDFSATGIAAN
ncbi:MAG: agmatine deiminase family protein, partial [bacterium]